ncbi:MAG: ribose-phosphate diphosphokinase [Candidatus Asgardarchaeum californiense]|nr:MAG: ribose-phosphate diphosphokinase [Candidatus Asgardarchaeum californiense]
MYIISGTASKKIAEDLSEELGCPLAKITIKRFPDNELYVRIIEDIKDEDIVIVQTTYPDQNIIELFLLQDAAYDAGANRIITVIPYFGYSRQDKKFEEGEPVSAQSIAERIGLRTNSVITVDPHKEYLLDFFNIPAYSCTAIPEISKYLKDKNVDLVLAPDKGAKSKAQQASKIIGCKYDYIEKTRIDGMTVKIKPKNLDAKNKKVAIIDDIISTGGTMAKSVKELKKQGAEEIFVACTHGLFVGDAKEKLISAGCDEIVCTDTIPNEFSKIKTATCIAEMLLNKKLYSR